MEKTKHVTVYMTEAKYNEILAEAKENKWSMSTLINELIDKAKGEKK